MAKREFNSEVDIRNFRSKVLLLPKKLLVHINQMIDDGAKEWRVENYIKKNYKGTLGCPTPPTIKTYLLWYTSKKKFAEEAGTPIEPTRTEIAISEKTELVDLNKEHKAILSGETDITNKKKLLESLIKKCIERLKRVESVQEMEGTTASLEAVVGHYIKEIHSLTTTQLKLSDELQEETNETIQKMINANLYSLVQMMFRVITKIAPNKVELIKTEFYEELQSHKQLQDALDSSN